MTTGLKRHNFGRPVDFDNGQEASNGIYINKEGIISRGKNLIFGELYSYSVSVNFTNDDKFKNSKYKLVANYHTHPTNSYIWPSPQDVDNHLSYIRTGTYSEETLLAIGFRAMQSYLMLVMQIDYNSKLHEAAFKLKALRGDSSFLSEYAKFLKNLFDNSEMIIIGTEEKTNYLEFFKNNPTYKQIDDSNLLPNSCMELLKEK